MEKKPDWQKTLELVKQFPVTENMFPKRKKPVWICGTKVDNGGAVVV